MPNDLPPNVSLKRTVPRRRFAPSFVAPVTFVRWASTIVRTRDWEVT